MKARILFTICLIFLTVGNAFAGNRAGITLKEKVYVGKGKVFLGQIADVSTDNKSLSKRINDIYIARTPPPGCYVRVSKRMLKVKILNAGLSNDEFKLNMSPTVKVYSRESLELEKKKREKKAEKVKNRPEKPRRKTVRKESQSQKKHQKNSKRPEEENKKKVRRGDPLKVFFVKKNLVIKLTGTAAETGKTGERIRVYVGKDKKVFRAVLQDESTALIEL
ncbi:MAG: flagella basal body P-ring formation protein FlgA [Candidatus Eremiobacteraeota bacterium]|nr:flagella basal body P-ring formation protein FlgA [Candidatus Eremiobacteraeota bacterium]